MAQLEYGDYYKFVASAGIALVAAAVVLPWMFLREPFDLVIEASKIGLLTPDAQVVIRERQHLIALAVHVIPYVSGCCAALGLLLTGVGLHKWTERQTIRDKSEDLALEKQNKELEQMSPAQIEEKAKNEIEDAEQMDEPLQPAFRAAQAPSAVSSYLAVEQALLGRMSSSLGASMKLLSNRRLGNVQFDAILRKNSGERIIVEIKYIRKGFNRGWLSEAVNSLNAKMALYTESFRGKATGLLLIVIATPNSPLSGKVSKISEELTQTHPSRLRDIRIRTIEEATIATISDHELRSIVFDGLK